MTSELREHPAQYTASKITAINRIGRKASLLRIDFHQPIEKCPSFIHRLNPHAFVQSMNVATVRIAENSIDSVGRNARWIHELRICRTGFERRDHGNSRP